MQAVLLGLVFYLTAALATQTIFNADCAGEFLLPCTGNEYYAPTNSADYCRVNPSYPATTVTIGWGRGQAPYNLASSLEFVGYNNIPFTNNAATYYKIGQLNHFNYPIICQPPCDVNIPTNFGFVLQITISIQLVGGGSFGTQFTGQYNMYLDETPNQDLRGATYAPGTKCPVSGTTEDSWVRYNNGWPGLEGANAVCCQYYTAVPVQGPAGYAVGGFCSDRITFTNFESPTTFTYNNEAYTLLLQGFSITADSISTDTSINYFTSQEYQEQIGYIWASLTKTCTNALACNDNNDCTTDACDSKTGTCTNTPTPNIPCTQGPSYDYYYKNAECQTWTCNAGGSCMPNHVNDGKACNNPQNSGTKTDCYGPVCVSGACYYSAINSGNPCTDLTPGQCQEAICNSGSCMLQIANSGQTCTAPSTAGTYAKNEPQCNTARCSTNNNPQGSCSVSLSNSNTACTTLATAPVCNVPRCKTKSVSGVTVGTCTYSLNSGDTTCTNQNGGTCQQYYCVRGAGLSGTCSKGPQNNGNSCTIGSSAAPVCNKYQCNSGTCEVVWDSQNTKGCVGSAVPAGKQCVQYACQQTGNTGACTLVNSGSGGSCTIAGSAAPVCNTYQCNGNGVCAVVWDSSNTKGCTTKTAQGSCYAWGCVKSGSVGTCSSVPLSNSYTCTGPTQLACNALLCNGQGACTNQWVNSNTNSAGCTGSAAAVCQDYVCQENGQGQGACVVQNKNSGSCSTPTMPSKQCNIRQCSNGNCVYQTSNNNGACTDGTANYCNVLQCQNGACVNVGTTSACTKIPAPNSVCATRVCNNQVPGSCVYAFSNYKGSCSNSNEVEDGCTTNKCVSRANIGGSCSIEAIVGGTCTLAPGAFSSNDKSCWSPTCIARATPNTGGTCTVSIRNGGSCSLNGAKPCNNQFCTAQGNCEFSFLQSGTPCNTGGSASFCNPQECNTVGSCVFNPLTGPACSSITYQDSYATANCLVAQCYQGVCTDVTNTTAYQGIAVCESLQGGQSLCLHNVCEYKSPKSSVNKQGTCRTQLNPAYLDLPCVPPGPTESLADQLCWTASCTANGTCQKTNVGPNTFCDVPNNETFGCSQFNCHAGTCNYAKAIPLLNDSSCTGAVVCDPSEPSCNSECEQFRCINGQCVLYQFNEGNTCIYLKQLTARDSENPGGPSSECTIGKCQGGVCLPAVVANGTFCGNRTLYNNSCYGDYCNDEGYCINTGLKDCSGEVPLPSVCWSAVCNPSNGDCELESNGVIDCSCIDNCAICTAESEVAANDTSGRTLSCYWCNGVGANNTGQGCYDRRLPGNHTILPPPSSAIAGSCSNTSDACATGSSGLTGGQIAGIVVGVVGFAGAALALLAVAALLARWAAASGTPPADALLQDLDFNSNVNENVFFQPLGSSGENVMYEHATATFITN